MKLLIFLFLLNCSNCFFSKNSQKKPASVSVHIQRPVIVPIHKPVPVIVPVHRPVYHSGSRHNRRQCIHSNSPLWLCCFGVVQWKDPGASFTTACCHTKAYDTRFENCCIDGHVRKLC